MSATSRLLYGSVNLVAALIYFLWRRVSALEQIYKHIGGTQRVMVTVKENGHGEISSNPGRGYLYFTLR